MKAVFHLFAGTYERPRWAEYPIMSAYKGTYASFDQALDAFRQMAREAKDVPHWGEILWEDKGALVGCWLHGEGDTWQIRPKPVKDNWLSGV